MCSLNMLLRVVTLALLAVAGRCCGRSSSSGGAGRQETGGWCEGEGEGEGGRDLSGPELTELYNSKVLLAELMKRPMQIFPVACVWKICHSGVRVTLEKDHSQWLIHKVKDDVDAPFYKTVVTDARYMTWRWKHVRSRYFHGRKRVSDFVAAGGPVYDLASENCHHAADNMMDL